MDCFYDELMSFIKDEFIHESFLMTLKVLQDAAVRHDLCIYDRIQERKLENDQRRTMNFLRLNSAPLIRSSFNAFIASVEVIIFSHTSSSAVVSTEISMLQFSSHTADDTVLMKLDSSEN